MTMKNYIKQLLILAVILPLAVGCDDGDAVVDEVTENTTRGAILRTYDIDGQEIDAGENEEEFTVTLEVQDIENGDLLDQLEVYTRFIDNTDTGDGDLSTSESLIGSFDASEFSTGEFGYPRIDYSISLGELISANSLDEEDVLGQDQFRVRFELVLTDGRRFSFDNNTGTLTGNFFRSPFQYTINVTCPAYPPTPGEWSIAYQDSFGDGWNGASLDVIIDGETTNYTLADGSSGTDTFTVPSGTESIAILYRAGSFDEENTFQVESANGNTVLDLGPSPTVGIQLLDYCDLELL